MRNRRRTLQISVGGRRTRQAVRDGMIVVPDMRVHMAAAVIEGRYGMCAEDRIERCGADPAHAILGYAGPVRICRLRPAGGLGLQRDHVGHGRIFLHIFRQTLYAVILIGRINIGARSRFASLQ